MERYCVNLVLSWNILVSPSMVIESLQDMVAILNLLDGYHILSLDAAR